MSTQTPGPGEIRADCAYPLEDFKPRTGMGVAALRTARRNGLIVRRVGRRAFVLGRDFIAYLESAGE